MKIIQFKRLMMMTKFQLTLNLVLMQKRIQKLRYQKLIKNMIKLLALNQYFHLLAKNLNQLPNFHRLYDLLFKINKIINLGMILRKN
jgi:hypothetical protein